eukprot:9410655-Pyramimonas_sp.AAC.1
MTSTLPLCAASCRSVMPSARHSLGLAPASASFFTRYRLPSHTAPRSGAAPLSPSPRTSAPSWIAIRIAIDRDCECNGDRTFSLRA